MTAVSKNVYVDVLDDIVDDYNNTYHRTTKMNPIDVKSSSYAEYTVDFNKNDIKFQVGDNVRISKYKVLFAKWYAPNWLEEVFVIRKIKNTILWTYTIDDLNDEEIIGTFYPKIKKVTDHNHDQYIATSEFNNVTAKNFAAR